GVGGALGPWAGSGEGGQAGGRLWAAGGGGPRVCLKVFRGETASPGPAMPLEARALDLPPPFRLVTLREVGDAFAHASAVAGDEGAGTLVHVGRFDLVEFAVVLEPDERLSTARC